MLDEGFLICVPVFTCLFNEVYGKQTRTCPSKLVIIYRKSTFFFTESCYLTFTPWMIEVDGVWCVHLEYLFDIVHPPPPWDVYLATLISKTQLYLITELEWWMSLNMSEGLQQGQKGRPPHTLERTLLKPKHFPEILTRTIQYWSKYCRKLFTVLIHKIGTQVKQKKTRDT